jgi:hypothetical protein
MHEFVADATLRLEFVKKVQAKIAENDPKFLSFEISTLLTQRCTMDMTEAYSQG